MAAARQAWPYPQLTRDVVICRADDRHSIMSGFEDVRQPEPKVTSKTCDTNLVGPVKGKPCSTPCR
jgi:hypothetical protein